MSPNGQIYFRNLAAFTPRFLIILGHYALQGLKSDTAQKRFF